MHLSVILSEGLGAVSSPLHEPTYTQVLVSKSCSTMLFLLKEPGLLGEIIDSRVRPSNITVKPEHLMQEGKNRLRE